MFAGGYRWLICSNDPDKTFNEAADHIIYQWNNYTAWAAEGRPESAIRSISATARICATAAAQGRDPDECVKMIRDYVETVPITHYFSWTLPPGLPPKWAQPHLELFASKVIPAFR